MTGTRGVALWRTAPAAALFVLLTGCTGPDAGSPAASPSRPGSSSGTAATSTADLRRVLLTAADLGPGYRPTGTQASGDAPLPCTPRARPLFVAQPPARREVVTFGKRDGSVVVTETVARYGDEAAAKAALRTGAAGYSCSRGTVAGTPVGIVARSAQLSGTAIDQVGTWDFANAEIKGTAALLRVDEYLVGVVFGAQPGAGADVPVGRILTTAAGRVDDLD